MKHLNRRHALISIVAASALLPTGGAAAQSSGAAAVPAYGPNDGKELSPGRRLVEIGEAPSEIAAYKSIKIIDVVYQPGAADPTEAMMDMDMVCHILAGEFTIKKMGKDPYTVKAGDIYTCGKGRTDQAKNISNEVGIHRIALLIPA
jgi:hypothetical protein